MLKKKELINMIALKSNLKKYQTRIFMENFIELIIQNCLENDKVQIRDFGTFKLSKRSKRKGINPLTLKKINIPAYKTITFKPSLKIKERLNK